MAFMVTDYEERMLNGHIIAAYRDAAEFDMEHPLPESIVDLMELVKNIFAAAGRRNVFSVIEWQEDDIVRHLDNNGLIVDDYNIEMVIGELGGHALDDKCISSGNDYIDFVIEQIADDLTRRPPKEMWGEDDTINGWGAMDDCSEVDLMDADGNRVSVLAEDVYLHEGANLCDQISESLKPGYSVVAWACDSDGLWKEAYWIKDGQQIGKQPNGGKE